jgi:outer membrane protein assembly factor BamB
MQHHESPRRACCDIGPARVASLLAFTLPLAISACGATVQNATPTATPAPQGAIYLSTMSKHTDGTLASAAYALNLADGKTIWSNQVSGELTGVVAGGGAVYFSVISVPAGSKGGTPNTTLESVNPATGAKLWSVTHTSGQLAPLAATSDMVFANAVTFTSGSEQPSFALEGLRASDGHQVWTAPESGYPDQFAGLEGGALYQNQG